MLGPFQRQANRPTPDVRAWPALIALAVVACSSSDDKTTAPGAGGKVNGTAGAPGAGGAPGGGTSNSGGHAGAGGDPSVCHASTLSTAPLECLQDWSHATAKYKAKCKMDGGYQAHCDPYDAILVDAGGTSVSCYYDTGTGNLIGARSTQNGENTCVAFDTTFAEPDRAACVPAEGGCSGMP